MSLMAGEPARDTPGESPGDPLAGARLGPGEVAARPLDSLTDTYTRYEELVLDNGMLIRRYDNGAVRLENPTSGVIQEERIDGKLLVSLPTGKVVFQQFSGDPLLVYDTMGTEAPGMARVSSANLPGEEEVRFVYYFSDHQGAHIIDLKTLRYYRVGEQSAQEVVRESPGEELPRRPPRPDPEIRRRFQSS